MPVRTTLRHKNESFESLMRRWKKAVEKSEVLKDYYNHEFYEKPSVQRKRDRAAAVKRWERKLIEDRLLLQQGYTQTAETTE